MKYSADAYLDDYLPAFDLVGPPISLPFYDVAKDAYEQVLKKILEIKEARGASRIIESLNTRLTEIARFQHNWDTYDADPPSAESVRLSRLALRLAEHERVLPNTAVASAEGGVALCWDSGAKHAYVEFGNDGTAIVATYQGMAEPSIQEFRPDISFITDALKTVHSFLQS
jgi:hypothetical protein